MGRSSSIVHGRIRLFYKLCGSSNLGYNQPMEKRPESPLTKKEEEQDFFDNKIKVLVVSKDEFLEIMRPHELGRSDDDILQAKGSNFDQDGETIVLMRNDIYPEKYLPYLEIHEKWEAYVARKDGYNLWQKASREYQQDNSFPLFTDKKVKEFYGELSIYNYEFRHEYAVYKEYQKALEDGNLEEYHNWKLNLRKSELLTASEEAKKLLNNDTEIRESVYKKLMENGKHYFKRDH